MEHFIVNPTKEISGEITVPGDKSISHRSIILGSIAKGTSFISGFLAGEDSLATLQAFSNMGVNITRNSNDIIIKGVGMHGLKKPNNAINLGNSGTAMRLMAGLLVAQNFNTKLIGDKSLSSRPMARVIKPLTMMGAKINSNNLKPPLAISGVDNLVAIDYKMPIASAQVKSAILLASLYAKGKTNIQEIAPSRDHTERMLASFGYNITVLSEKISVTGGGELSATNIKIPADISSASFFITAACIASDANIVLKSVNINPTRTGIIDILKLMGANIKLNNQQQLGGELLADICVKPSKLKGIKIPSELVPLAIDEFPIIFIAASCADGETTLTNAKELRVKESDRIKTMADGLDILGIKNEVLADGIIIQGGEFNKPKCPIDSYGDHRIAMAFAIASLRCQYPIRINNCDNVKTSFPNFVQLANKMGMDIRIV